MCLTTLTIKHSTSYLKYSKLVRFNTNKSILTQQRDSTGHFADLCRIFVTQAREVIVDGQVHVLVVVDVQVVVVADVQIEVQVEVSTEIFTSVIMVQVFDRSLTNDFVEISTALSEPCSPECL